VPRGAIGAKVIYLAGLKGLLIAGVAIFQIQPARLGLTAFGKSVCFLACILLGAIEVWVCGKVAVVQRQIRFTK
jgi:hypothetical protein